MNWYKKAQNGQPYYDSIGHGFYQDIDDDSPNFLWIFINKNIIVKDETNNHIGHISFGISSEDLDRIYKGRYESSSGYLTLVKPREGILAFRDEPKNLRNKLHETFPYIERIFEY